MSLKSYAIWLGASAAVMAQHPLTPNGRKAGAAGDTALAFWKDHLSWWHDWTPAPSSPKGAGLVPVSMLWGGGNNGQLDAQRLQQFEQLQTTPDYVMGFNEPDCSGADVSADIDVSRGVSLWNSLIAPMGQKGALLGSPAMCRQKDESWLKQFNQQPLTRSWDFTSIHIFKPDMTGVQADIDYYWNTYQKPLWVTEFACVFDQNNFTPCTDQNQINQWISDIVDLFEANEHVLAYAYTDGLGLGSAWPPVNSDGSLSQSGQAYLTAISKYH
ncbi:glycoside hydrolase family 128 protein [Trichoderma chlorosporum]